MLNLRIKAPPVMQCTLLIPHLLWPGESAQAVSGMPALPALTRLLGRARSARHPALTPEAWLCQAFEVERQQDLPVAPLTAALDNLEVGDAYWLRADPVHLRVDRDRALLVDGGLIDVTLPEAKAFTSALTRHFADDGLEFFAPVPQRWYVKLREPPRLITRETSTAAGKDVDEHLPAGGDALAWHALFNEVQMLLHEHGVNDAREARGEPAVNSVWFWGGGVRPAVPGRHFDTVWSDDTTATALAAAADLHAAGVPADAATWLELARARHQEARSHLLVLGELAGAAAYGDVENWARRVAALESHWFAPLAAALRDRTLSGLALVVPGESGCWRFDVTRADLAKFWRSAKPLSAWT